MTKPSATNPSHRNWGCLTLNFAADLSALIRLLDAIGKEIDHNMPWHQGIVFLTIAEAGDEGIDMRQISRRVGIATSSVSRNVAALGYWHRLQRPGLGLVCTGVDPTDRRRRPVRLTNKGKALIQRLQAL